MLLQNLLRELPTLQIFGLSRPDIEVKQVRYDTRSVEPGDIFVALRGSRVDGHTLFLDAIQQGAVVVVGEDEAPLKEASQKGAVALQVTSCRSALALASCIVAGSPSRKLKMLGVTGTNGKTTTTYLTESVLRQLGMTAGVIGTVEYRVGDVHWPANFTTPEAPELQSTLAKMLNLGATHAVMEVSSHGLASERVGGIEYHAAAFTNLTQDHLDFHKTMEDYFEAKAKLFAPPYLAPDGFAILNVDDPKGRELQERSKKTLTFSIKPGADADLAPIKEPEYSLAGIKAKLKTPHGELMLESPLVGPHNLANVLTAFGLCLSIGASSQQIAKAFEQASGAPGRLERVVGPNRFDVFVDYAHSPDALERVLIAMRPLTPGRLIAVFGCGGDRDKTKRPLMGEVVGRLADLAVVTSDNPRTEDPLSIISMIIPGVLKGGMAQGGSEGDTLGASRRGAMSLSKGFYVEADRKEAIELAVSLARPGDALLLFGKGHEDYQIIGTNKIHFDDREEARRALGRK